MTATLSAAALRMPHTASVAAPAPLALGVSAEPRSPMPALLPANRECGREFGGITLPAFVGRRGGTDGSDRFGGAARNSVGKRWYGQDWAQITGGGPLRG